MTLGVFLRGRTQILGKKLLFVTLLDTYSFPIAILFDREMEEMFSSQILHGLNFDVDFTKTFNGEKFLNLYSQWEQKDQHSVKEIILLAIL